MTNQLRSIGFSLFLVAGLLAAGPTWPSVGARLDRPAPQLRVGSNAGNPQTTRQAGQGLSSDILLEIQVDESDPYVRAQVLYTVRLFYPLELSGGKLSDPKAEHATIQHLPEAAPRQTRRNGRLYWLLERRYAVFPQTRGTVTIVPPVFTGTVPTTLRSHRAPFGGYGAFDRFTQRLRSVRKRGEEITLKVQVPPASVQGRDWLPAKHLTLTETWVPDPPVFRVGEPVTRSITVTARGAEDAQLPTLSPPMHRSFKAYSDKESRDSRVQGTSVVGSLVQKMTLVPTEAGHLTLPELRVRWWDTGENREKVATLPARAVDVSGGAQPAASGPAVLLDRWHAIWTLLDVAPGGGTGWSISAPDLTPAWSKLSDHWTWLIVGLGTVWLATLLLWRRERRQGVAPAAPANVGWPRSGSTNPSRLSTKAARHAVQSACRANETQAARDALLAWAKAIWHPHSPMTLVELADRLADTKARDAISALDRLIYSRSPEQWHGGEFWQAVSRTLKRPKPTRPRRHERLLPALTPHR